MIVVVAILAAVSIVAYRGIQQRAASSVLLGAVNNWEMLLRVKAIEDGDMPAGFNGCLGRSAADFPATAEFPAGACLISRSGSSWSTEVSFDAASWSTWPSSRARPSGLMPTTTLTYGGTVYKARGAWVYNAPYSGTGPLALAWLPQVSGQCGHGLPITTAAPGDELIGGLCYLAVGL